MADPNPMLSYVTPERRRRMGNAMMAEQYNRATPEEGNVVQRAGMLPFAIYDNGQSGLAFPGFVAEPVQSFNRMLENGYTPGDTQGVEDAFNVAGAAIMGGFAAPKPRNVVGSAGGSLIPDAAALDMSHAARMKRAADEHHPSTFYHGTVGDYPYFDLSKGGQVSGSRAGSQGVSVSPTPDVANVFAQIAADKSGGNASVMPLRARLGKVGTMTLDGSEKNLEVAASLQHFFEGGYDTVVLKNYTTPGGVGGNTILVVKDPAQLRSVNAAFDPAKRDSADLLSANGGRPGAATGVALGGVDIQDPALAESLPEYGLDVPSRPASPRYRPGAA